ncbi:MAG: S8 family serine peptidase, partial [Chlorobi bacterium]|nr:S8 family serine peptidase [Chlorobiota bacterium]
MKKHFSLFALVVLCSQPLLSQVTTNVEALKYIYQVKTQQWQQQREKVEQFSKTHNMPVRTDSGGVTMEMQYIDKYGMPQSYMTENLNAAKTISTDKVQPGGGSGLSLDGSGMTVYEWDAGAVLSTHQEFGSRVSMGDTVTVSHYHSTHVGGTMIASGVDANAKGMAPAANLKSFDWNSDYGEMAWEAAKGALVSNHSYGFSRGWTYSSYYGAWFWYGTTAVSTTEDYLFGFYDDGPRDLDEIAYYAPYYLIVKSAGNDRNDNHTGGHYVYDPGLGAWVWSTAYRDPDGDYDCIGTNGIAKNIVAVGSVEDIPGGYSQPSDVIIAGYSSWGPADDGRVKPDIVANGQSLYSTDNDYNSDYISLSGTSMAAPTVTASMLLLQQHYHNLFGRYMRASTLKALVVHTADEAGSNNGPDYMFGWGLMNTKSAADKITENQTTDVISEHVLVDGGSYSRDITTTGTNPVKVTVVWTDPPGAIPADAVDPPDVILVNDLDLRVVNNTTSTTYYPWKLDKTNPANAATNTTENNVDNVEVVYIDNPTSGTTYTITVDHDGTLSGGRQVFSIIISGDISNSEAPVADFFATNTTPGGNEPVTLTDASDNIPTSWLWSISPSTFEYINGTSGTSQNPEVKFTATGTYDVTLYVENAYGNDTKVKTGYITVSNTPSSYCEAYSSNPYGYISRVQLSTLDNISTYTNVGDPDPNDKYYEDFTALTVDLNVLQGYTIAITNGTTDAGLDVAVWIDWNRDGDFYDTDENIVCEIDGYGAGSFAFTVPAAAKPGNTRMRIRTKYYDGYCYPCGSTLNGEVEDYTVNINAVDITWQGTISTDWNNSGNWDLGVVPTTSFNVIIPSSPTGGR